jgi:membrane protein DedA with SNARE-associated domain
MASWVMQMMSATGYVGLVLLMVLENVFPPIPSEVISCHWRASWRHKTACPC